MPDRVAGYLIHFDEERRNHLLNGTNARVLASRRTP